MLITVKPDTVKKVTSYTALSLLAAVFILSSSGIYLTIHHCTEENVTELFLFKPPSEEPCEHHKSDPALNTNSCSPERDNTCHIPDRAVSDCWHTGNMPWCCSNTLIYIAIEDTYIKADQPENSPLYNISDHLVPEDFHFRNRYIRVSNQTIHDKAPPHQSGKEIAFLNRALLL